MKRYEACFSMPAMKAYKNHYGFTLRLSNDVETCTRSREAVSGLATSPTGSSSPTHSGDAWEGAAVPFSVRDGGRQARQAPPPR